jgi:hypothetical protein
VYGASSDKPIVIDISVSGGSIYGGWDWYYYPVSFNYKEWRFNEIEKEG